MVHEAKVSTDNNFKLYYGTCKGEFKSCFCNHTKSFRGRGNETELSKYIWQLKDESKNYNIYCGKYIGMQCPIKVAQDVAICA